MGRLHADVTGKRLTMNVTQILMQTLQSHPYALLSLLCPDGVGLNSAQLLRGQPSSMTGQAQQHDGLTIAETLEHAHNDCCHVMA